ncbi:MAG TPA: hypothetical protein VLD57_06565, partial [Blastocatellia bacterium]|nr:hypothetical protein [Blastocatellia bacterium]
MKISKSPLKSLQCLLVAMALTTMFSLRSFATVEAAETAPASNAAALASINWLPVQGPSGTITGSGQFKVNGNEVQTGATVLSGNSVSTGSDGDVLIDVGQFGRVKLRPNSTVKLDMIDDRLEVTVEECTRSTSVNLMVPSGRTIVMKSSHGNLTNVAVTLGEVRVKPGADGASETIMKEGESRAFDPVDEIVATGDADFTVNCCDCDLVAAAFFFPPLVPILVFAGVATGIP